ncbi:hypothetical protein FQN50_001062 [Emmonsiellopsis sp. PD_5]|nr:hypothetical protein FQN50_001062 [Emmonsiellopsis sp. PD_5]
MATTGRYVPPALRNRLAGDLPPEPPTPAQKLYQHRDIEAYFGHAPRGQEPDIQLNSQENSNHDGVNNTGSENNHLTSPSSNDPSLNSLETHKQEQEQTPTSRPRGTLNTTAADRDTLAYIVLFNKAHPYWESRSEVFCRTNIDLLPAGPSTISYPLFVQQPSPPPRSYTRNPSKNCHHKFAGFHLIKSIRYLEPRSQELAAYLEAKFGNRRRESASWRENLNKRWAVICMELDEKRREEGLEIPEADEEGQREREGKGVNELLREMRGTGGGD